MEKQKGEKSMFYVIMFVIGMMGLVSVTYLINMIRGVTAKKLWPILLFISAVLLSYYIGQQDIRFSDGYTQAIEEARVEKVSTKGYVISFNGESHEYTWD